MKLFIDMDGTLAEWRPAAVPEELLEKNYFASLRPTGLVGAVRALLAKNSHLIDDVYILSAVIPESRYAKEEKLAWVMTYLPMIHRDHILFSEDGKSKLEHAKEIFGEIGKTDFLLDDYSRNLKDWRKAGSVIKFYNGINGNGRSVYENSIVNPDSGEDIQITASYLERILQAEEKWMLTINNDVSCDVDASIIEGSYEDLKAYFKQTVWSYVESEPKSFSIDIDRGKKYMMADITYYKRSFHFFFEPYQQVIVQFAKDLLKKEPLKLFADKDSYEVGYETFESGIPFSEVFPLE